jgi:hypothetical protein
MLRRTRPRFNAQPAELVNTGHSGTSASKLPRSGARRMQHDCKPFFQPHCIDGAAIIAGNPP